MTCAFESPGRRCRIPLRRGGLGAQPSREPRNVTRAVCRRREALGYWAGRISAHNRKRLHIRNHDRTSGYDSARTQRHTAQDNRTCADPHVVTDGHGVPTSRPTLSNPSRVADRHPNLVGRMVIPSNNLDSHPDEYEVADSAIRLKS